MRIRCLLVVLGCILWNGHAQSDDDFIKRGREIVAIFNNPSVNQLTKYQNIPALVDFYEKYSNRLQLTAQQRSDFDSLVRTYRQNKPMVGRPVQRGVWLFLGLFQGIVGIINQIVKKF
ncbi:protein Turandot E-like [Drosophila biarmipes]|uniref:protein Turandot E-like n=1 Tax=Drosophila biarmipes TaxID=125945 RepID=UPI001CDB234E|nr:protein Turandot E-like [Drosophila biarmipes]